MARTHTSLLLMLACVALAACSSAAPAPDTQPAAAAPAATQPVAAAPAATRPAATQPAAATAGESLKNDLAKAPALSVENLGTPVKSVQRGELMRAANPDGKTVDLLQWYFRGYGGPTAVAIIDTATGEVKKDAIPDNLQIHICGRVVGPDGKLYIATPWGYRAPKKGMELFVYDPATNQLSSRGVAAESLGGENRPMTVATDGMVFGTGSYPDKDQCGLYQIDTATGTITDFGPVGPSLSPNGCWAKSIAADDQFVYITTGHHQRHVFAVDRKTREATVLLTAENIGGDMTARQLPDGCTVTGQKIGGTDGAKAEYWLYHGKAIPKSEQPEAPWLADGQKGDARMARIAKQIEAVEVYAENAEPVNDGQAQIWYRLKGSDEPAWKQVEFQVAVYPASIGPLTALSDGRILGTAGAYTGNFMYDAKANKMVHLGKIHLSHYSTAEVSNLIYMSGYPSSPLFIYDPAKPWTAGTWGTPDNPPMDEGNAQGNPRRALYLRQFAGTHKMLAAAVGADGKAYFGGTWIRDGAGGGLAWWDPKTQAGGGMWEIFSNYRITHMAAADSARYLALSTAAAEDTVLKKPTPAQGKVFVFDTRTGKISGEFEPVAKARELGPVAGGRGPRILGATRQGRETVLWLADVVEGKVIKSVSLPVATAGGLVEGPDGRVWTIMDGTLVRINMTDLTIQPVGKLPRQARFVFSGKDLYFAEGPALCRIKDIVPAGK